MAVNVSKPKFDWIVIGAGLTGAALSYELQRQGFSVLLLERSPLLNNATRFSYGGVAYWSGTTELTCGLCVEAREIYRTLDDELEAFTGFRDRTLLMTIPPDADPQVIAATYAHFAIVPTLVSVEEAILLEPLLNPHAIGAALTVPHGHLNPELTVQAYCQAFQRFGGVYQIAEVTAIAQESVTTVADTYQAENIVVCAGAWTRSLLARSGFPNRLYFTHAEIIETEPVELSLQTLVMPAQTERFDMEAAATRSEDCWNQSGQELAAPILDVGVVQLSDRRLRIGQISRVLSDLDASVDAVASETLLRSQITSIIPSLKGISGTWRSCLVSFSGDRLPVIGRVSVGEAFPKGNRVYVFSGFSNPFALVPPLARRFARQMREDRSDPWLAQLSPQRFTV